METSSTTADALPIAEETPAAIPLKKRPLDEDDQGDASWASEAVHATADAIGGLSVPRPKRIKIIFDTRERLDAGALVAEVKAKYGHDIAVEQSERQVEQLALADIVFVDADTNRVLMLAERKSVSDYLSSMKPAHLQSKRLVDQLDRMKSAKNVPRLCLLLTGDFSDLGDTDMRGLVTKTVRLQMQRPHIDVVHLERPAEHLSLFLARCVDALLCRGDGPCEILPPDFHELQVAVRKSQTDTPRKAYEVLLQLLPGWSARIAAAVVEKYPSLDVLARALEAQGVAALTSLKVNKRAVPSKAAKILVELLAGTEGPVFTAGAGPA